MVQFNNFNQISSFIKEYQLPDINTLADLEKAVESAFQQGVENGAIGVKTLSAYSRTIQYDDVPREKAEEILIKMKTDPGKSLPADVAKQLEDFLFYKILSLCEQYDLPIQIHTGIQTFNGNWLANTNPILLTNTIMRFPKVKFLLLHSGYPYGGETAALAKMFTNVYIDMTWTPLISPSYAVRYLQEYIETVPQNKIMAFGGDCNTVEGTYSASVLAREVVVQALVPMVRNGYLSEEEAIVLARKILRENAIKIYKLDFLK
jgi:predicted TIM-barrel fold metal-dependent hydrolase